MHSPVQVILDIGRMWMENEDVDAAAEARIQVGWNKLSLLVP